MPLPFAILAKLPTNLANFFANLRVPFATRSATPHSCVGWRHPGMGFATHAVVRRQARPGLRHNWAWDSPPTASASPTPACTRNCRAWALQPARSEELSSSGWLSTGPLPGRSRPWALSANPVTGPVAGRQRHAGPRTEAACYAPRVSNAPAHRMTAAQYRVGARSEGAPRVSPWRSVFSMAGGSPRHAALIAAVTAELVLTPSRQSPAVIPSTHATVAIAIDPHQPRAPVSQRPPGEEREERGNSRPRTSGRSRRPR